MEFEVEKHTDEYMKDLVYIKVSNLSTGQSGITSCQKKEAGRVISELKKDLQHI